jgi:hypothetical protein
VAAAFAAANALLPVHGTGYVFQIVEFHVSSSDGAAAEVPQRLG